MNELQSSKAEVLTLRPFVDTEVKPRTEGMSKMQKPLLEPTEDTWQAVTRNGHKEHDEEVIKLCQRLKADGYHVITLKFTPDAIATKDGKLVAIEVLKDTSRGHCKQKKQAFKDFDEVIIELYGTNAMNLRYRNDPLYRAMLLERNRRYRKDPLTRARISQRQKGSVKFMAQSKGC